MNDTDKYIEYLQQQISNQDKLASLGMLSAGIVHEIQNPLNFVINFSKLSGKLLKDMEDVLQEAESSLAQDAREELKDILADLKSNIAKIEENGHRVSGIIRGILLYSRGKDDYMPTDLKELVHEYIWLSYHAVRAGHKNFNVRITEDYAPDIPLLNLIPQDLSRAVLNIMNNACYAVFSKLKEASAASYEPAIRVEIRKENERVKLMIEDNGTGIPPEVREKLYTPFFTTKPVGEGTGLGLSICKSIIENKHKGSIEMDTTVNEFTRFTVSLPLS
ncbi:MAG: GHKL domain-containing protein [Tannerellaceae bacterium]|jgi:signal transduction histidine kinase|nr:GHKL domain-containing protein [Tannerellaceae bacterium]